MEAKLKLKFLKNTSTPPGTQKAKGLWTLVRSQNSYYEFNGWFEVPQEIFLGFSSETEGYEKWPWTNKPTARVFCRPCPKRPRHGFVDSREIKSWDEAGLVLAETLAVDNEAELVIMPFINSQYSSVYVPEAGVLDIGRGHDGATSGKDVISLVIAPKQLSAALREEASIQEDGHTYLELLHDNNKGYTYVVQARSGPKAVGGMSEYIPKRMQVKQVLTPSDDLLAHESLCVALAGAEGVVFQLAGSGLTSHAAIHCTMNGIAFLTRKEPVNIGDWIEPTVADVQFSPMGFQRGVRITEMGGTEERIVDNLHLAIGILRNTAYLQSTPY